MKNSLKYTLILASLFLFIINVHAEVLYTNSTTGYEVIIEDDAYLLTESEISELQEKMQPLTEYGNIMFKSIDSNYSTTAYYAKNYYHQTFGTSSGTMFLIDMDNRNIYIFSDGSNYKVITDSKENIITDNVYKYASTSKYFDCASNAFSQMNTLLNGKKISEPMRYISSAIVAIIAAFFINFFYILGKSKIKDASVSEIIKNCDVKFDVSNIDVKKTGTHRVYSPISNTSGGGSCGSGGGGGGSSSGGGGGHSF